MHNEQTWLNKLTAPCTWKNSTRLCFQKKGFDLFSLGVSSNLSTSLSTCSSSSGIIIFNSPKFGELHVLLALVVLSAWQIISSLLKGISFASIFMTLFLSLLILLTSLKLFISSENPLLQEALRLRSASFLWVLSKGELFLEGLSSKQSSFALCKLWEVPERNAAKSSHSSSSRFTHRRGCFPSSLKDSLNAASTRDIWFSMAEINCLCLAIVLSSLRCP